MARCSGSTKSSHRWARPSILSLPCRSRFVSAKLLKIIDRHWSKNVSGPLHSALDSPLQSRQSLVADDLAPWSNFSCIIAHNSAFVSAKLQKLVDRYRSQDVDEPSQSVKAVAKLRSNTVYVIPASFSEDSESANLAVTGCTETGFTFGT